MDGISIVIISRGREKLLEELLQSVREAQGRTELPTEIILVDSSPAGCREKVKTFEKTYGVRYFYEDITVSAKRNFGAKQSRYEVILFLDSDCLATPELLKHYADIYERHPEAGGAAGPLEFVGEDTWFWKVVEKTPYTIFFSSAKWGETLIWAPTANFSVKREAFFTVGGFDESFPKNPGGEDVDLGLRLSKAGYTVFSAPEAMVYHSKATWSPVKAMFRRVFHYGAGDLHLMMRYPQMGCSCMPRRFFVIFCGMLVYLVLGCLISPWFWLGIAVTPFWEMSVTSLCVNRFMKYKGTAFGKQLAVQTLLLWNEAGYLWECICRKQLKYMGKQMIHFKPQMDGICYQNAVTAVIYGSYLLITYLLVFLGVQL